MLNTNHGNMLKKPPLFQLCQNFDLKPVSTWSVARPIGRLVDSHTRNLVLESIHVQLTVKEKDEIGNAPIEKNRCYVDRR